MLNEENYTLLNKKFNENLITNTKDYLHSHHIINWYDEIKENTFETFFTTLENAKELFKNLNLKEVFVKDYVKSIKTGKGSIVDSLDDIDRIKEDMLNTKDLLKVV